MEALDERVQQVGLDAQAGRAKRIGDMTGEVGQDDPPGRRLASHAVIGVQTELERAMQSLLRDPHASEFHGIDVANRRRGNCEGVHSKLMA